MQTTSQLLMIRPVRFGYNAQTAVNNAFQQPTNQAVVQDKALQEFNRFTAVLLENGVDVTIINDTDELHTPDSLFPNNWITFHENGAVFLYPMFAENRRIERRPSVLDLIRKNYVVKTVTDLSKFEAENKFLEGTGSMVLDRDNMIAYACLSARTDLMVFDMFCKAAHYKPVSFHATDQQGIPVYHTNVMMCLAEQYVVICADMITNAYEKEVVLESIIRTNKEIVFISEDQVNHFAGNMLQVQNNKGEKLLVMSSQAYDSLTEEQVKTLEKYNRIIHSNIETIETNGGGSTRCMMAEIHLPML